MLRVEAEHLSGDGEFALSRPPATLLLARSDKTKPLTTPPQIVHLRGPDTHHQTVHLARPVSKYMHVTQLVPGKRVLS